MSILRVRNINKTYRSSKVEVRALRDVNLDIKKRGICFYCWAVGFRKVDSFKNYWGN